MRRSVRLGTPNELDSFGLVAVVARSGADEFTVSNFTPDTVGGLDLPRSFGVEWARRQGLSATVGSTCVLRSLASTDIALISGGDETLNSVDEWRRMAAAAVRAGGNRSIAFVLATNDVTDSMTVGRAVAEGAVLASYEFSDGPNDEVSEFVVVPIGTLPLVEFHDGLDVGVREGAIVAESVNWAKKMIDTPPSQLTPKDMAKKALRRLEGQANVTIVSWAESKIEDERLGGLLGVSRGSAQPPRLVYATYDPEPGASLTHVALVGKGITFDSGGLSLKTGEGMMTMKTDMSGAAVVLAVLSAVADLGLRVKLTVIAPMTENLPGHRAIKPGDVLTIRNGKTIEVLNTDAEGRLVLADGLALAVEASPDAIIDVATLTGAQVVALGDEIAGLFASDDDLAAALAAASDVSGEPLCRLPLHDGYDSHIESDVADMKNIGKPGKAGSIAAALLLRRFTDDTPWAHFDIAGPGRCDGARGYYTKGATAFSARTIIEYLRSVAS
jgi:leucyl aminopeptidase